MRRIVLVAVALAASVVATPLSAQINLSVAAGATMPVSDASDLLNMGYNASVGLGFKAPLAPVGLRIEGMYNALEDKNLDGASYRVMAGTVNMTLGAPMLPMTYLIGGAGMYNLKSQGYTVNGSESDVGFNVGAGLNLPLTGFSTFLEARYHRVMTEGQAFQFVPVTFGIRF